MKIEHIWPLGGIEDLPGNWQDLGLASMREAQRHWKEHLAQIQGSDALHNFTEQLNREWAIETGRIENLYDIEQGVTVSLIEQGFEAVLMPPGSVDRDPNLIVKLLNDQASALEGLFAFVKQDRPLSISYILELHQVMTASQESVTVSDPHGNRFETELLKGQWKKHPNYPQRDGRGFRYCPPEQVASEMDRMIEMHLAHAEVLAEVEAAWIHHRFTQIHPFQDGNGRMARALATLVLIRSGLFPMVVSLEDKESYIEALERADRGDLRAFIFVVARGQQKRARTALRLAVQSEPDSESVREAITRLAATLSFRHEAQTVKIRTMLSSVNSNIRKTLKQLFSDANGLLQQSDPASTFGVGDTSVADGTLPQLMLELPEAANLDADGLACYAFVDFTSVAFSSRIEIYTAQQKFNTDSPMSFIVLRRNGLVTLIQDSARLWTTEEIESPTFRQQVEGWAAEHLPTAIDSLRRSI